MSLLSHIRRGSWTLLLLALPIASASWACWGVFMAPEHGTDLHTYQAVGRAIAADQPIYSNTIPGQFLLSPVGGLGGVALASLPDLVLHLGWGILCALAALALLYWAGVRGFALSLLTAIVLTLSPGRVAMTQGRLTWLIMLAVVVDLIDWERRPRWLPRGAATGLATAIWPFTWPFLVVLFLCRRRAGLVGFGTFVAASAVAAAILPRMTLVYWSEVVLGRLGAADSNAVATNQSLLGAALRTFGPEARWPALLVMAVAGAAAIVAAVWWDRLGRPWLTVAMTTVALLVASPVLPHADLTWILLPVIAATLARATGVTRGSTVVHVPGPPESGAPDGLAIVIMFTLAWILADPMGALPRGTSVEDYGGMELLVSAGVPLLALALTAVGLWDAWAIAHADATRGTGPNRRPVALADRFWHHPATLTIGSLVLGIGAAAWYAAITDADVRSFVAWDPQMADFGVYIRAAQAFLAHEPLYTAEAGQWPFLYPPFAAILALPLGVFPRGLVQFGWIALTVAGLMALLHRLGLRGWNIAFATMVCIFLAGPIRSTIGLGQVSILLMVMCLLDLAPGRGLVLTWLNRRGWIPERWRERDRLVPAGVFIGIATAIKLTPGLFIPLLWLTGRRRTAVVATVTTAAACLLGFVVSPRQSVQYWTQVALGGLEFFPDPRGWMHNQSWVSAWQRFVGLDSTWTLVGIGIGGVFTVLGLIAAIRWVRRGQVLLGASLCGLAALLVLPVAWNHYFVWALPLGVALLRPGVPRGVRRVGLVTTGWLITEPFWTVAYAGPDPLDFVGWGLGAKIVGGAGAFLTMAFVLVALTDRSSERAPDDRHDGGTLAQSTPGPRD